MKIINSLAQFIGKYLVYILIIFMIIGFVQPPSFLWAVPHTTTLLGVIMFCMGMTLDIDSFKSVVKSPKAFIVGLILQFTVSPLAGYLLVKIFNLPAELAIGMILMASTPGGTASNVMTFLSEGDVALTVSMTAIATLLASVVTPLLVLLFAREYTEISFVAMLQSVLKMVFIPIVLGIVLHYILKDKIDRISKLFVLISSVSIICIVSGMVAKNGATIVSIGYVLFIVILIHNLIGYAAGYFTCRLLGISERQARSVTFQVGMKNTGLAISLGNAHFTPMTAIPGAVGGVIHQISGPILANIFLRKRKEDNL